MLCQRSAVLADVPAHPVRMTTPHPAMPSRIDTPLGAVASVALSAACFGAMAVFVRTAYAQGADMPGVLLGRFVLASLALWLLLWWRRVPLPARGQIPGLVLMGIAYTLQSLCFFGALLFIPAGMVALLLYLYPLFVVLLSWALGLEPLTRRRALALAVCSAGTLLTLGWVPWSGGAAGGSAALDWRGVALGVAAACIYALYLLGGSRAMRGVAPLAATTVALSAAAVLVLGLTAVRAALGHLPHMAPTALGWSALGAIALVSTVLAMVLLFAGLARLGPSRTALISTLEPVVTVLAAWFLLGEHLGPAQLAGGVLVLGGALLLAAERHPPAGTTGATEAAADASHVQKA